MTMLTLESLNNSIEQCDQWLLRHPTETMLGYTDRLLVRLLYPIEGGHSDVQEIIDKKEEIFGGLNTLASIDRLPLPDMIILLWAFEKIEEKELPEWRHVLEPIVRSWAGSLELPEPHYSAAMHWANLIGWCDDWESGETPPYALFRMYHYTHLVYYATDYGSRTIASADMPEIDKELREKWQKYATNSDLIAEILLVYLAFEPLDKSICIDVANALLPLQQENGSFIVTGGDHKHHHHSSCVAWLALSRLRDVLTEEDLRNHKPTAAISAA